MLTIGTSASRRIDPNPHLRGRRYVSRAASAAAHLALVQLIMHMTPPGVVARLPTPTGPRRIEIVRVAPPAPPEDEQYPGLEPVNEGPSLAELENDDSTLSIDETTFDVARIARRAAVLFPFLSPGLSLELFAPTPDNPDSTHLRNPLLPPTAARSPVSRPLQLGPKAIQALVDRTWSRKDRWEAFQPIRKLADGHGGDAGDLPLLIEAYGRQNLRQYFADRSAAFRDPRLWTELELASDHVDFIELVRRHVEKYPSTRSATELLFVLDMVAESNLNVLDTLLTTKAAAHLSYSRLANPRAYRMIGELQQFYRRLLERKGLTTPDAIIARYSDVRVAILEGIIRTTPEAYRASDARFLIGAIRWSRGDSQGALTAWCRMSTDARDVHVATYSAVLTALSALGTRSACATRKIDVATRLAVEHALSRGEQLSWEFQVERLRKFGYRVDTF
jgi:hypothetical protein